MRTVIADKTVRTRYGADTKGAKVDVEELVQGRESLMERKKVGRPEKYTPEVLAKLGQDLLEWFARKENIWLKDFATLKGFHWAQFSQFASKSDDFSLALKRAKDIQESKLVKLGLSKEVNSSMAIFALKNVSGWRDVQEVRHDPPSEDSPRKRLADAIARIANRTRKEEPAADDNGGRSGEPTV
jgi:hypothetical protein